MSNEENITKRPMTFWRRTTPQTIETHIDNISYFIPRDALPTEEYFARLLVMPKDLSSGMVKFSSWSGETVLNNVNIFTHIRKSKSFFDPTLLIQFTSFKDLHSQSTEEWSIQELNNRLRVRLIRLMGSNTSLLLPLRTFSDEDKDSYAFLRSIDFLFDESQDNYPQNLKSLLTRKTRPKIKPIRTTHHINRESTKSNLDQPDKSLRFNSLEEALEALSRLKTIIESSTTTSQPTRPSGPILPYTS